MAARKTPDKPAAPAKRKPAAKKPAVTPELKRNGRPDNANDSAWIEKGWALHCMGADWSTIARQFHVDRSTAKSRVLEYGATLEIVAPEESAADLDQYLGRLQLIMAKAWETVETAGGNVCVGALRVAMDAAEKIAAARGVVTERKGMAVSGQVTAIPLPVFSDDDPLNHFEQPEEATGDCDDD